ncbi:MAG: hypothetical protein JNM72_07340 [Deltaproteobacteria bacterium]|nr:hypothetical protein [Deltaproteobacteria bacterium]
MSHADPLQSRSTPRRVAPPLRHGLRGFAAALLVLITLAAAPAQADGGPKTVLGPTLSTGHALKRGAPSPLSVGLQTIVPKGDLRLIGEVFLASPSVAYTPALGGDLAVGMVNGRGLGGALGVYGKRTLGADGVDGSTQVGPAALMLAKVTPGVFLGTPLVFWYDTATDAFTPTLTVKLILGLPIGG